VNGKAPIESSSCNILGDCQDEIIAATERQLGIRTGSLDSSNPHYDFVMFCMPDGTMFGGDGRTIWVTFACTGDQTAFFQKGYCGVMSTAMHELDHLMDFGHSNEGDSICQDKLGVLGSSIVMIGSPNYCLNGHKLALSGWTDERKKVVSTPSQDAQRNQQLEVTGCRKPSWHCCDWRRGISCPDYEEFSRVPSLAGQWLLFPC
jgi:hypothetical protein